MLKIYHNPHCQKSRTGLEYLKSKTSDYTLIEYMKEGLTKEIIEEILLKTNRQPQDLIRTQEEQYKKELKGKNFTREEWIQIIIENPKLLQRPIVAAKHKAVLAIPPEKLDQLL